MKKFQPITAYKPGNTTSFLLADNGSCRNELSITRKWLKLGIGKPYKVRLGIMSGNQQNIETALIMIYKYGPQKNIIQNRG